MEREIQGIGSYFSAYEHLTTLLICQKSLAAVASWSEVLWAHKGCLFWTTLDVCGQKKSSF